jgi:hypothetical protein
LPFKPLPVSCQFRYSEADHSTSVLICQTLTSGWRANLCGNSSGPTAALDCMACAAYRFAQDSILRNPNLRRTSGFYRIPMLRARPVVPNWPAPGTGTLIAFVRHVLHLAQRAGQLDMDTYVRPASYDAASPGR